MLRGKAVRRVPPAGMTDVVFLERINKLSPMIRDLASSMNLPPWLDKEDLIQEAWIHLYKQRNKFDGTKSCLSTWCWHVTRNCIINHASRAFSRRRYPTLANTKTFMQFASFEESYVPVKQNTTSHVYYRQLVERVRKLLCSSIYMKDVSPGVRTIARKMFDLYVHPTDEFLDFVKQDKTTDVRNYHFVEFLDTSFSKVVKARKEIKRALRDVMSD